MDYDSALQREARAACTRRILKVNGKNFFAYSCSIIFKDLRTYLVLCSREASGTGMRLVMLMEDA